MRTSRAARRRLRLAALALGWSLVVALAVSALLRFAAWDDAQPLVVVNSLSLLVYLPAWLVAAAAALGRKVALTLVALAVVSAQLVMVLPELAAARALPAWAARAPQLRLLDANVSESNSSMSGYVSDLRAERPDLVTLEEATPRLVAELAAAGVLDRLPHRYQIRRDDPWAFLVASDHPLGPLHVVSDYGRPLLLETSIRLGGEPVALWVLHTVAPLPSSWQQWAGQLQLLRRLLRPGRRPRRLLLVGDFNATWGNRAFRAVLAEGLVDAAAARGDPLAMTWSQGLSPLPPLLRIDHVLTSAGLAVTSLRTAPGIGSDHRELLATVAVEPRPG